ncbi:MAG: AAA family ATPase [Bacilli bacterium]|nr:AAA family ATPase [Bacilli bacterium]
MNKNYLNDIYKDFFGKEIDLNQEVNVKIDNNKQIKIDEEIENLLVSDESKELLKKIILYIKEYKDDNYLSFNLIVESDNKETKDSIRNIIKNVIDNYDYIENNNQIIISFYELDDINKLKEIFEKNSLIILKDIKALELKDDNYKRVFVHLLEEYSLNKNIIIIEGLKEEINYIFELNNLLEEKYFPFKIIGKNPDVLDIYQEILNITKSTDEEFNVKILDYISKTFNDSKVDYPTYRDNLCREIMFNHDIPKLEVSKSLDEIFAELNELVGLDNVKKTLHELVDLISLKDKADYLKINNVNLHMVFLGNPGTGKTTVARIIADILYNLKYIKQNKLIEVSNKDLVAEYVGQTSPKTMAVIERAMGGVLFIDEAYALASKNTNNSFNEEAIATLIKAMEDYRDDLVVIFAGYTKEMQDFLESNSGIVSRIGYTLEFNDYTSNELIQIFNNMMKKSGFIVKEDAIDKLRKIIDDYKNKPNFGNARFIRNVYEKTVIKHAANTKDKKRKDVLKTITKEDISIENIK